MKARAYLLIAMILMSVLSISAQMLAKYPVAQMHSTSTMVESGSLLPNAASNGVITADDLVGNEEPAGGSFTGPRRSRPGDWEDPFKDPLTDAVPCLLLLALGYVLYLRRKKSVTTLDSQNKQ